MIGLLLLGVGVLAAVGAIAFGLYVAAVRLLHPPRR
jgi:hypothetical protein